VRCVAAEITLLERLYLGGLLKGDSVSFDKRGNILTISILIDGLAVEFR